LGDIAASASESLDKGFENFITLQRDEKVKNQKQNLATHWNKDSQ
jgi:hypothetical protein